MENRYLGNSGLRLSLVGLGCNNFGQRTDLETSRKVIHKAIDLGITLFDTADIYCRGESELILGRALKEVGIQRDGVVLATKVRGPMSNEAEQNTGDVNNIGLSRKHIMASCDASLERLGTDYIDLYQIHGWDNLTPIDETMRALDDLVRQGKVRYVG